MDTALAVGIGLLIIAAGAALLTWFVRSRLVLGTTEDQATYRVLHMSSLATPALRAGLQAGSERAARHLRDLLSVPAVALTDGTRVLAWDGTGADAHALHAVSHAQGTVRDGSTAVLGPAPWPALTRSARCGTPSPRP